MGAKYLLPLTLACLAPLAVARVIDITDEAEYEKTVLGSKQSAIVEFAATWCGVCNRVKPSFEEVSDEPAFKNVAFVRVDIDNAPELRRKNGIVGVPSFLYVQGGQNKHERVGVQSVKTFKDDFRKELCDVFELDTTEEA